MNRQMTFALGTAALLCLGVAGSGVAMAQTAKDLVGTWMLVSGETTNPNGSKTPTFGANPKGVIVFGSDGRFTYVFSRADLPKFASNSRATGTPEENKAVVQGSIGTFGMYSLAGTTLTLKIEQSTFPNWIGAEQPRTVVITGDDLKWTNPAGSSGGVVELAFKRSSARATN